MNKLHQIEIGVERDVVLRRPSVRAATLRVDATFPKIKELPPPIESQGKVAILMGTYRGQRYLADQLESIATQTYSDWEILASDDGSEDDTRAILERYRTQWGEQRLSLRMGPAEGFVANFLSLICDANVQADYYAYSDQDDIWEVDKLERAVKWLKTVPPDTPALYCSRTRLVDDRNQDIGFSPLFSRRPSFNNALMQNIGGGNTMVFNNATRQLLRQAGDEVTVVTHDWWTYLIVMGCGGRVFYDSYPTVRYRQHDDNLVGMNNSLSASLIRIHMLWQGSFVRWNDGFIAGLTRVAHLLTPENRAILDLFAKARKDKLVPRLIGLKQAGIYRQTMLGNFGLVFAALFKKL